MRTTTVKSLVAMPSIVMGFTDGHPPIGPASPFGNSQEIFRKRGTDGSNPVPPASESVSAGSRGRCRPKSRLWRRSGPASGREKGTRRLRPDAVWPCFSLAY